MGRKRSDSSFASSCSHELFSATRFQASASPSHGNTNWPGASHAAWIKSTESFTKRFRRKFAFLPVAITANLPVRFPMPTLSVLPPLLRRPQNDSVLSANRKRSPRLDHHPSCESPPSFQRLSMQRLRVSSTPRPTCFRQDSETPTQKTVHPFS